jgi:hypothetical protein
MQSALSFSDIPLWAVALVFAGFAPFCARAWGQFLERRVRERSVRRLATFGSSEKEIEKVGDGAGAS